MAAAIINSQSPHVVGLRSSAHRPAPARSFGRLLGVEFRKLVDTRAGFWLLLAMAALTLLLTLGPSLILGYLARSGGGMENEVLTLREVSTAGASIMATITGVLAVLTLAGEWGQRASLTTFTLEPRRGRVLAAKVVVILTVALALWALSFPLAMGSMALSHAIFGAHMSYGMSAAAVFGNGLWMILSGGLLGLAWGLLLQNSPGGIIAYLVLPILLNLIGLVQTASPAFEKVWPWLNPTQALTPFAAGSWHLADFGPVATSAGLWIVLPAVIGTWRWLRRECK